MQLAKMGIDLNFVDFTTDVSVFKNAENVRKTYKER